MKTTVLIDLDNTLIDFNKCAYHAIADGFKENNLIFSDKVFTTFLTTNNMLWKSLENGELTKDKLREIRWKLIFEKLAIEADGQAFEKYFEDRIAESAYPVDGADELLTYLQKKYDIYIVTNGFESTQKNRLKIGGFDKYINGMFVSETVGAPKPSKEFFDVTFRELGNPDKESVILIGDSINADILGGKSYGIDTIWFDRTGETVPKIHEPTYTVKSLGEIMNII